MNIQNQNSILSHRALARGSLLLKMGKYHMAFKEVKQAIYLTRDDPFPHYLMALILLEMKYLKNAEYEAREAIRIEPERGTYHLAHALILAQRKKFVEADVCFRQALNLEPVDASIHASYAQYLLDRGRYEETLQEATKTLEIDPQNKMALQVLGWVLFKTRENHTDAILKYRSALAVDPNDSVSHNNLGVIKLFEGDKQGAIAHFSEALRLDPCSELSRRNLIEAVKSKNKIYGLFWEWNRWLSNFPYIARVSVIIGAWFIFRTLVYEGEKYPGFGLWIKPILFFYIVFCLFTWVSDPVFNFCFKKGWIK